MGNLTHIPEYAGAVDQRDNGFPLRQLTNIRKRAQGVLTLMLFHIRMSHVLSDLYTFREI